jgi:hypothetical protein
VAAERKAYIMKARRRALATLIVLTGGAVAIAVTRWPPRGSRSRQR